MSLPVSFCQLILVSPYSLLCPDVHRKICFASLPPNFLGSYLNLNNLTYHLLLCALHPKVLLLCHTIFFLFLIGNRFSSKFHFCFLQTFVRFIFKWPQFRATDYYTFDNSMVHPLLILCSNACSP